MYSWIAVIFFILVHYYLFHFLLFIEPNHIWDTGYIKIDCNRTKSQKSSLVIMNQLTKLNTSFLPCHRIFDIVLSMVLYYAVILLLAACKFSTFCSVYDPVCIIDIIQIFDYFYDSFVSTCTRYELIIFQQVWS